MRNMKDIQLLHVAGRISTLKYRLAFPDQKFERKFYFWSNHATFSVLLTQDVQNNLNEKIFVELLQFVGNTYAKCERMSPISEIPTAVLVTGNLRS